MNNPYDVVVIGAGMVGVSTALQLQQKNQRVLLIDTDDPGRKTSYGNAGLIEPSYVLPFAPPPLNQTPAMLLGRVPGARMGWPSGLKFILWALEYYAQSTKQNRVKNAAKLWPLLQNVVADHKAQVKGSDAENLLLPYGRVQIHRTEKTFAGSAFYRSIADEYGAAYAIHSPEEMREIEPDLKPAYHKAIVWKNSARYFNPGRAIVALAQKFTAGSGTFVKTKVQNLSPNQNIWSVKTDNETYHARNIALCAGPWANDLLRPLGLSFPLAFKRGYHRHYQTSAKFSHAIVDTDFGYLGVSMEQGLRITTGGELADVGAKPNPVQLNQALTRAGDLMEFDPDSHADIWMGARPCTTDSLPIIGPVRGYQGLWVNIGHGHCGITLGPPTARLLAEMITGGPTFCDPAPYSPNRF